jgi:hexosaminidase
MFGRHDGVPHGGYYTQDEIGEIVSYAAERQITIVPEIDMPGHARAALAAYPELSCTGGPFEVSCRFGPTWDLFCAGQEEVFAFLGNVLDEVVDLFDAPWIHIGGDEAPKARWKRCPRCQRRIREQGLAGEDQLQVYFTNRIAAHLQRRGRTAIGWNQILGPGLAEGPILQYWIGNRKRMAKAVHGGRQVIISPFLRAYLDHSYTLTPLSAAYRFEPVLPALAGGPVGCVLGVEGLLWTEFVRNRARLDYQTYPRLTALAEVGWSPAEGKDYGDFRLRLARFAERLDALGVQYARGRDAEPSWLKRLFGPLTVLAAQTKTAS